jgi:hypothetical protein
VEHNLPTFKDRNLAIVYAKVMLGKRVNWNMVTIHNCANITKRSIDIPTNVNWNRGSWPMPLSMG